VSVVNDTLTFSHAAPFAVNATYNVTISTAARSIYGDALAVPFTFNFTTARAPVVLSTVPTNDSVGVALVTPLRVVFDQAMDAASTASAFSILPAVNGTGVVTGPNLTWTHLTPFAPSTLYRVNISRVAASAAGARLAANFTFEFTTAAIPVKSIVITDPPGFALWYTGEQHPISWVSVNAGPGAKVDLFYNSTIGGEQAIVGDMPSSGTYVWTVPQTALGLVTLRAALRDPVFVANGTVGVLILPTFIVLVNPPTATVDLGSKQMFMATALSLTGTPIPQDQVAFVWQFSDASVGTVDPMFGRFTNLSAIGLGTGTMTCIGIYNSVISTGLPSQVTVVAPPPPSIELIEPRGGEAYPSDSEIEVRWRANASLFPLKVDVEYSLDNGSTFSILAKGVEQSKAGEASVKWKVAPDLETSSARVRVTAVDPARSNATNTSGAFSILTPVELRAYSALDVIGVVDRDLRDLSVVGVVSRTGRMVPGVSIHWEFVALPDQAKLYTLNVSRNETDSFGFASARFHLGDLKGEYLVKAESDLATLLPVVFTATARPGPPDVAFLDPPQATVSRGSRQTFTVTAYDAYSNLIEQPNASWSVTGGIGSVSSTGVFTGERIGKGKVVATLQGETGPVTAEADVQVVEAGIAAEALPIMLLALLLPLIVLALMFRRKIARVLWAPKKKKADDADRGTDDPDAPSPVAMKEEDESPAAAVPEKRAVLRREPDASPKPDARAKPAPVSSTKRTSVQKALPKRPTSPPPTKPGR
ncbi:MAG TPA: Ig-like domain-containing protein, partial [Thermoplasmata archaeon]|nr:Ig-like domain-containing protein [Thermoplasmata archaeon]